MLRPDRQRKLLFTLLCAACVLITIAYWFVTLRRSPSAAMHASSIPPTAAPLKQLATEPDAAAAPAPKPAIPQTIPGPEATPPARSLYFRANALGDNYGKLSTARLDALEQRRFSPQLSCDRVHFSHGTGVCLASKRGVFTTYSAVKFERNLSGGWSIPLNGVPSRTRVSPNGSLAAITTFVSGHSYASLAFSTQTIIVDTATGNVLADLENFSVTRDGAPFQSPDFNFWGVTFQQNEDRFFATLASQGKTYLLEGNLRERTARIVREGVECPSLSPDNTRIAFKKRAPSSRVIWRIHVLDLKTMTETPLNETRNVDDQVEWMDDQHILYALTQNEQGASASTDIWVLPATADGIPRILLHGADSPAVDRGR